MLCLPLVGCQVSPPAPAAFTPVTAQLLAQEGAVSLPPPPTFAPPRPTQEPELTPTPSPPANANPRPPATQELPLAMAEIIPTVNSRPSPTAPSIPTSRPPVASDQRPPALAVPFTTEWESISAADVQAILTNGHPLVIVTNWAAMPTGYKALRVDGRLPDDPLYPLGNGPAEDNLVHLAAVGDLMLARGLGTTIAGGNLAWPFANVAEVLRAADVTVGNLESSLGDVGQPAVKSYTFQAPPAAAQTLALAGFDVLSLANNHALDYGPDALLQGIGLLSQQGIATVGAGVKATAAHAPHFRQVNGLTLAFLGYVNVPVEGTGFDTQTWTATDTAPGLAWATPEQITADVTAARQQADLVIVILHSGYEYVEPPSPPQVAAARAAIDAGASLVLGHHAHVLQGIEFYKEGVIAYGLANFAFVIDGPPETAILNVWLDAAGVRQLEIVPAINVAGQPRLATAAEAATIRRQVYRLTTFVNPR
ncbi:MAG: CapA family protein [Chloroflexota bacterium]